MTGCLVRAFLVVLCVGVGVIDASARGATAVAGGIYHTCALTADGGVYCWGRNASGQLGDGTTTRRVTPTPVSGLGSGVLAIAAGGDHTCALMAGGGVRCWGSNSNGALGDGTTTDRSTPTVVSGLGTAAVSIVAGGDHTCALTTGGGVVCWGSNYLGQLGDGTDTRRLTPTPVSGLGIGVAAITAGSAHTCALTTSGGAVCWGSNTYGQIGDGTTTRRLEPTAVSGLDTGVTALAAGWGHSCAATTNGDVQCWGTNLAGNLGDGTTTDRQTPTAVVGLGAGAAAVAGGIYHTCGLTSSRGLWCWGSNPSGQLGDGTTMTRLTPVAVSGLRSGVGALTAGMHHTCAVTMGGGVLCWGFNIEGQLGDGTTTDRWTPTPVAGFGGVVARYDFTGDLKGDVLWRHATLGQVWLWPMNGTTLAAQTYVRTVADTTWEIRGIADFDGNGKADILWRNQATGQIYLWPMDGSSVLSESYVATVDTSYDIVGTGDYDGDGKADILWRHSTSGQVWIWLMSGSTTLSQVHVDTVDPGYAIVGSGDLNADGKADIVWRHTTTGAVWVWLMNGTSRTSQTYVATVADLGYQIVGVADFDGNGKGDILWRHATRGEVWVWPMDGAALVSQSYVDTVPDTGYQIVATGDYDGDGKADILWHHATRGEVWVWLMNGTTVRSQSCVATVPDTGYQIVTTK